MWKEKIELDNGSVLALNHQGLWHGFFSKKTFDWWSMAGVNAGHDISVFSKDRGEVEKALDDARREYARRASQLN